MPSRSETPQDALILAFDLGTQSLKTALFDRRGAMVATASREIPLTIPHPGWAEQEPSDWWTAMIETVADFPAELRERVAGMTFCAQMCGTVAVDTAGQALHPALIWLDTRSAPIARRITGGWPNVSGYGLATLLRWLPITNGAPNRAGKDPVSKILWLRENRPDVWDAAACFLDVKDWLVNRCTGRFATTPDCAHLTWLMDSRRNRWSSALTRRLGIPEDRLPAITPSTSSVGGGLSADAAAQLGLSAGLPVFAGAGDLTAIGLGAGALESGAPHIYVGTSDWCAAHLDRRKVDPWTAIGTIRAADADRYLLVAAQETAGACFERAAQWLGLDDVPTLLHLAAESETGARGLVFLPWLFGERVPVDDPHLRGAILNLSLDHGAADIARAVIEGVAFNTVWAAGHLMRLAGTRADAPVRLVGTAATSDLLAATLADLLDRPVERIVEARWVGTRGAAMCAAVGLGWVHDFREASAWSRIERTFVPDAGHRTVLNTRYGHFRAAWKTNRRWFGNING